MMVETREIATAAVLHEDVNNSSVYRDICRGLGQCKGVVGIESAAFPGRFLRLDAIAGTVNAQGVFMAYEEFEILVVG